MSAAPKALQSITTAGICLLVQDMRLQLEPSHKTLQEAGSMQLGSGSFFPQESAGRADSVPTVSGTQTPSELSIDDGKGVCLLASAREQCLVQFESSIVMLPAMAITLSAEWASPQTCISSPADSVLWSGLAALPCLCTFSSSIRPCLQVVDQVMSEA